MEGSAPLAKTGDAVVNGSVSLVEETGFIRVCPGGAAAHDAYFDIKQINEEVAT